MPLTDLTRPAVLAAIEEHDRLGREEFLRRYGFGLARQYRVLSNGREYDSKAIAGVAYQYARPNPKPPRALPERALDSLTDARIPASV